MNLCLNENPCLLVRLYIHIYFPYFRISFQTESSNIPTDQREDPAGEKHS